ncbi:PREDICTED: uncharacterized protein LOC109467186 [Branchiostoma belcheri]|uniref:Uncharacterized protein LOC109467186 n=1 Tax=Branchiostoma belcheri TaxID=7741 RepID=A0A6P4Y8C1_BRABE|nr:PREDICTED: uncharacterized protein LOC109467186 [Branchiostoma belcheri]
MAEGQGAAGCSGETAGVHKYFYYVKDNVSSDWKDLAFHLDFRRSDIDNIEGRNRDDKSRCMDLLEEWLKGNGERATIEVLMEALSEANLQSVVDGLRKKLQEVPVGAAGTESSSVTGVNQTGGNVTDLFQESVKKYYELKLTHFKPLIWNDNFTLSLSDIFTQLELIQTLTGKQRKELKSLDDLFKPDVTGLSTAPRCILIEGEAGGGKTTFLSKEALDAVSQKTELGRRHNIVLLIRLREVREGETIEEMVWDQCVDETTEGIEAQSIRTILQRNKSCVLFLLDGYDELRPEARAAGQAIPKLLSGKMYPDSTIVITSRPSAGVQQYTWPDCHVHIMGFSEEHVEEYMQQYFTVVGKQELAETLAEHVEDNNLLDTLIQTPMFLMFVCLLWEEDQEMVSTGTMMGLYDNLLTCLVRKCCEREGVDMPTEGLPTEVAESLLQLGKLSLEALLRNETLLDLTEVKREKVNWELLLKLGVVSLEVSSSKLHPRKQLNFSHKTMQEFLAGRYVADAQVNQDIVELLQLTSISKAQELSNLLQFTCGCDSQAAQAVMEELSKLSSKEFSHLQPDDFQEKTHLPVKPDVKKSVETYKRFMLLCLNILNERKELGVLQAVSRALPVIILNLRSKQPAALQYYLQNIQSSHLPDRMILESSFVDRSEALQYLEQIFTSHVPGLKLDLRLHYVTFNSPDLTARLVSVLKNVPCLRALGLSRTELTPSSLQPLVQGFRHMSLLEELDLTDNHDFGDAGMEVLQVGLSSVPHLAVLCLGGNIFGVGMTAVGMSSLAPNMRHLVGLRELDIGGNAIGDTGLESLTTVLHTFTAMQVLLLSCIGIRPTGMRTLVPALCKLTRLIKLDIGYNALGDPGLECLAAILHHLTAMKVLVLSWTLISDRGISSLIKALPHLVQLQVLDVSDNNIGDSGIVSLVQTLCQPSSLVMEQNPPGDKSLTTAPHYNTTLQELHIGRNRGVTGAGLGRVAQVISTLPALTRLDMSGPSDTPAHLSDTAAMDLAEALPRLPALEQLDLQNISMEPAGFQAVVQAAEEHPTLEKLRYYIWLVPEGADTTASCLSLVPQIDVEEYFDRVINGISHKWDDLARKLGFNRNEIKGIRTDEPDQDHRCREVLDRWRNRKGRGATLQVLKQALINIDEQWTAESLEELREPQPSTSKRKRKEKHLEQTPGEKSKKPRTESDSEDGESHEEALAEVPAEAAGTVSTSVTGVNLTDLFQKSVKRRYELKLTHFKPLIWNDNFTLSLTDIFTQLELIQKSKHTRSASMREEQRKELKSLDDLFNPDVTGLSTAPRCILIEGEAGGGKTTFLSKEALDAVSQKTELGRRHDIVLLIRLREVREGETIEEMVWDQCVDETTEGIEAQSIRTILQRNEPRLLFLLDGYDELRPEARAAGQAIPKLLSGKMYPNSTIVITSRPSAGVQQYTRPDCHVHIMGFSEELVEEYMQQYFTVVGKQELTKTLAVHIDSNELLNTIIYTPMFLMFVCLLWEEDQEMVSTGTMMGLYDNLLTCLVRKCCKREGVDMPTEGLPTEVAESLLQLGKLALEALLRNETLLDLTEVKREKVNWELLLKLGVVSLEDSSSKLHPRKQLNFSHKTMQEFLAGRYVAHAQLNQDIVELLQLTSIGKSLELSNLLQFTCGCDSQAAQAVMEELSKLSSKEFSHLRPDDFQEKTHLPVKPDVKKSVETYKRFMLLCLNILNERKEQGVLQAVSRALPVIILDRYILSKQHAALKYYLENIQSSHLPDRMILGSPFVDTSEALQYLEQIFTSRVPGLQLDLRLNYVTFNSPDLTARLVSVLKNVPCLRALDLSWTNLTPSSLQPLVQGFRHMSLLEELDLIENSDLGDAGMEVLQVGLSSVPHLAVLRLEFVRMTAVGMSSLAPYMHHLVGLRELDIGGNKIGDTGMESLTTVLHTFTAMQVLDLRWARISPTGMRTLVPALCKLTRLIKLDISVNAIGDPGLECLAAILHHLTAIKVLVLSSTGISDRGISSLIKALPHLVQLQVLNVSDNNIGDSGIVSLVQTLGQPSSLDMEQNPPGDKSLTTAPHYNTTLQELHIGYNRGVTGTGLGRVAQLISTLPALTGLYMSGPWVTPTHLSDTAAMDLAKALPRLPALEELYLHDISMAPAGFQAVVQAAEEHPTLEQLLYTRHGVPEGADTTASCLELY